MTTERHGWISTLSVSVDERRELASACRCGQELDVCHGTHCPRCGSTVRRHPR
ncbi:hypothetical protein G7072_17910 [Nocardioides sp. HDW12B]|uniref:hypothetical protein n=1 Tax=Nocardioides sp. HDW12B TaxID=2714939 RepID=UPI00140C86BA|nr:hypothetical protein [Nocardioides sp. HDW12B]QIK67968.1 hypothetical protein G7072_17910 [Nocardioides sp. HDW12B]